MLYGEEGRFELNWGTRVEIVQELAHAITHLHSDCSPPIMHRDITLNNILLDSDFAPHLADFGTTKLLNPNNSTWTSVAGTYGYMAPGKSNSEIPDEFVECLQDLHKAIKLCEEALVATDPRIPSPGPNLEIAVYKTGSLCIGFVANTSLTESTNE